MFEYILGTIFRSMFPSKVVYKNNFGSLSDIDKVKLLERRRQLKGYKKQWLYYRCKEEGLLKEYNQLIKPDTDKLLTKNYQKDNRIKFSFGKYRGKPVEEVWEADKDYAKWVSRQEWIIEHPEIESALEQLYFERE